MWGYNAPTKTMAKHTVLLQVMYWTADRKWCGTKQEAATLELSDMPQAIDDFYAGIQEQINDSGGTCIILHKFDAGAEEQYRSMYPPKLILPIKRRTLIQEVKFNGTKPVA